MKREEQLGTPIGASTAFGSLWHPVQRGEDQTGMRQGAGSTLSTFTFPTRIDSDLISI